MARIRTLKPEFFTSGDIGDLEPITRLLFQGLWCHADKKGRLLDRPRELRFKILPYDQIDIDAHLNILANANLIRRYKVEGKNYIQVVNFLKHQRPHPKEADSTIPDPPKDPPKAPPAASRPRRPKIPTIPNTSGASNEISRQGAEASGSSNEKVLSSKVDKGKESGVSDNGVSESLSTEILERKESGEGDVPASPPVEAPVRVALRAYEEGFEGRFGERPVIDYGKDGAIFKGLIRDRGLDEVLRKLEMFLDSTEDFTIKSGYTIGVFKLKYNSLIVRDRGAPVGLDPKSVNRLSTVQQAKRLHRERAS